MRHSVDHLSSVLDEKLQGIRDNGDGTLKNVNDAFVFAFGPFMSMESGFETDCDEIAKYSDAMKIIQFAAFLIRRIGIGISYGDAKKLFRDFIVQVDTEFPEELYKNAHDALINFAISYKNFLREEQGQNMESFMTNSAPIIPYEGTLKKQPLEPGIETRIDCVDAVQAVITEKNQSITNRNGTLMNILLNNLTGIMKWRDLTTVIEDPDTGANNLMELDHLVIDRGEIPYGVRGYYFLATINYYGLPIEIFEKYLNFFRTAGDFSKLQSYDAFESMVDEMAETVNPNISLESWQINLEQEGYSEKIVDQFVTDAMANATDIEKKPEDSPTFDMNKLLNFISIHREMKADEYPKRKFDEAFDNGKILNVMHKTDGPTIYEVQLNNASAPMLVCPYIDVFEWKPRVLVLYGKDNTLESMLLEDFIEKAK